VTLIDLSGGNMLIELLLLGLIDLLLSLGTDQALLLLD